MPAAPTNSSQDAPRPPTTTTPYLRTLHTLLKAFNEMDLAKISSLRHPLCTRHILPRSLGLAPQPNEVYMASLRALVSVFRNFELRATEIVEDAPARKVVAFLRARADTEAGEYVNEYVWVLEFEDAGGSGSGSSDAAPATAAAAAAAAAAGEEVGDADVGQQKRETAPSDVVRIMRQTEFVDAVMAKEFFPKLRAAMVEKGVYGRGGGGSGTNNNDSSTSTSASGE